VNTVPLLDGGRADVVLAAGDCSIASREQAIPSPLPPTSPEIAVPPVDNARHEQEDGILRPLTSLSWPPEPDSAVFSDPLKRDDPKPLRHDELLRIGMFCSSPPLIPTIPG
jgi:hypothetical protein